MKKEIALLLSQSNILRVISLMLVEAHPPSATTRRKIQSKKRKKVKSIRDIKEKPKFIASKLNV